MRAAERSLIPQLLDLKIQSNASIFGSEKPGKMGLRGREPRGKYFEYIALCVVFRQSFDFSEFIDFLKVFVKIANIFPNSSYMAFQINDLY